MSEKELRIKIKGIKGDTGPQGEQGIQGIQGEKGDRGNDGKDGLNGKDGRDGIDGDQGPRGIEGKQGLRGKDGKDGKDGTDATPEQVKVKLLEIGLEYSEIKNAPIFKPASKTVSLTELDDVDYSGLSITNGKYVLGSGGDTPNLQEVTDVGSTTTNNIDALSFNSVALTATGSSTKFLAEDGTYVPVPTSGTLTYVLSSANSDIGGYESMPSLTDYTAGALASIVTVGVSTTPTLLGTFATDVGFPNVTIIPAGLFATHWETQKTAGSNNYYSYYEVYKRTAAGTETLLSTSDITTQTSVNTRVQQTATALLTANTTLLSTDRMVIKIYGVMLSATATITLYYDDNTDARFEMPSATVDATNFVPYTGATNDLNMGTKTITASSLITTGGTQTQFVTGDGQLRHIPIYTFFV